MSATSSPASPSTAPAPDATRARAGTRSSAGHPCPVGPDDVEGAFHLAQPRGGQMLVGGSRLELGVAEQQVHRAHVGALVEEVGGEAVPQRVRRDALVDPGGGGRFAQVLWIAVRLRWLPSLPPRPRKSCAASCLTARQ